MERNRDLRRTTVSAVNGLPRRRQRIITIRDSTDQDGQMELQATVRLGKDEREFPKRRRIDRFAVQQRSDGGENYREDSSDSSDEEYYEEEQEMRIHRRNQLTPPSSSLRINRRGLCTLRSSPVLRAADDEMFGGPIPRRARSSSAKRLHEYCNSGSGDFGEDLNCRRSSPSPASLIGSGDAMKKKMRSVERRTTPISNPPKRSVIQDEIEIEVAEALFDLMKQSKSQSQSSQKQVDRDGVLPASVELKMSNADGGKDENNAFSVQNEPSIKVNAEIVLADSMKEMRKEGTVDKKKFSDDSAHDLVSGDGFVNKVKVGSPKESESPSFVKVIAGDIQDPTVTKARYDAITIDAKKETKLEIDLMASPLPSSPERELLVDLRTHPGRREIISKDGPLAVASGMQGGKSGVMNSNQQSSLDVEKLSHNTTHQQAPTSLLLPFPYGMGGWPGPVPHRGFMPPLHAVTPINESAKSSTIIQPPQFKFSPCRPKKCATHQYLAGSIHCHQQLIKKSLSSGSTCSAALSQAKSPHPKYTSPTQNFVPGNPLLGDFQGGQNLTSASVVNGKDKSSDAAMAFNATKSCKPLLQPASHPASASNFLHGPGLGLPFDHHQSATMTPANSSVSPQTASLLFNSAGRLPVNLPLPNASTAMSLSLPMFPSKEAASYMAMIQNNGCSVPFSTNIAMPSFKGAPTSMAFFNPSLYPSPAFNFNQNQQQSTTSHASVQPSSQNTNLLSHKQPQGLLRAGAKISVNKSPTSATANVEKPSQLSSKSDPEIIWKNGASLASGYGSHSVKSTNSQTCAVSAQPMNFGGGKQIDPPQQGGSKGRVELIPQAFALSLGSNASATPVLNFSSMAQASAMFQMLPDMSQKNLQASEGKSLTAGGQSFNYSEISAAALSTKYNGFPRNNINFLPSSLTTPAAISSGFQQHQLIQFQDVQAKSSTPGSFFTTGIIPVSSSPIYTHASAPPSSFQPKWENLSKSAAPEGSPQSVNIPQLRTSQGQTRIDFGNNSPMSATSFLIKSEPMSSSLKVGSSSNSCLSRNKGSSQRNASALGLAASALGSSQEAEASQGQKSSPACRRNVPSILSSCPSQLPEPKY